MFTLKEAAAILSVTVQRMAQIVRERAVPAVANRKGRYYLLIAQDQVTRLQRDLVRLKDRREWEWRHFRERVLMDTEHLLTRNWLTMKQTAAVLNVSEDRVYNLRKSGRLLAERNYPRKRTDPVWRFYVCDIRKLLEDPEYRKNRTEYEIGEATRCLRIWETFVQCNRNRVDDGLSYQGMPTGGW
jgi:hypothetical protein